jgi:hypothetical protein
MMDSESILMIDECIEMNSQFIPLDQQLLKMIISRLNDKKHKAVFTVDECTKLFNISNQHLVHILNKRIENTKFHADEHMLQSYGISAFAMVGLLLRNRATKNILPQLFENGSWY